MKFLTANRLVLSGFVAAVTALGVAVTFMLPNGMPEANAESHSGNAAAIFAGGCFWCVESDFDKVPGVISTTSGYIGGTTKNPTYKSVTYGNSGHYEAVKIVYDPKKVSYDKLLYTFWRTVDPTDPGGQFCDRGASYKTGIFATTPEQKEKALASKAKIDKSGVLKKPIVTAIVTAGTFYKAEGYHQNYYKRNPIRYKYYRNGCRRDARIRALWGKQAITN